MKSTGEFNGRGKNLNNRFGNSLPATIFIASNTSRFFMGLLFGKILLLRRPVLLFTVVLALAFIPVCRVSGQVNGNGKGNDTVRLAQIQKDFDKALDAGLIGAARKMADSMISFARRTNIPKYVAAGYFNHAMIEKALNNTESFVDNLQKSIPWFIKGGEPLGAAMAHTIIGQSMAKAAGSEARENFEASLRIRQELNDSAGMASNLASLGDIHHRAGNLSEAGDYYRQAADMAESTGNGRLRAFSLTNLGNLQLEMKQYSLSRNNLEEALVLQRKLGYKSSEPALIRTIGNTYLEEGITDSARIRYEEALTLTERAGTDFVGMQQIYADLGRIAVQQGDDEKAGRYFSRSLEIARMTGDKEAEQNLLAAMEEQAAKEPEPIAALQAPVKKPAGITARQQAAKSGRASAVQKVQADSIRQKIRNERLALLKEKEIAVLKNKDALLARQDEIETRYKEQLSLAKRNRRTVLIAGLLIPALLLAWLLFRLRSAKKPVKKR